MMEFLIKLAITVMNNYVDPPLPTDGEAFLLIEMDGTPAQIESDIKTIKEICNEMKAREVREVMMRGQLRHTGMPVLTFIP